MKIGDLYQYDYEGTKQLLVIVDVSDTHIEYKLVDADGNLSHPIPMTRAMWNLKPDGLEHVGYMVIA